MSHPTSCRVIVPVCGSHTAASNLVFEASYPDPATISTLPLFMSAMWMGLIGIRYGSVVH